MEIRQSDQAGRTGQDKRSHTPLYIGLAGALYMQLYIACTYIAPDKRWYPHNSYFSTKTCCGYSLELPRYHNIYLHGEIRKISVLQLKKVPYQELWHVFKLLYHLTLTNLVLLSSPWIPEPAGPNVYNQWFLIKYLNISSYANSLPSRPSQVSERGTPENTDRYLLMRK